jgi:hypothetical protein
MKKQSVKQKVAAFQKITSMISRGELLGPPTKRPTLTTLSETTYRPACSKVCNDCPFRRSAMPGWLGAGTPESFIAEIQGERPLPCHQTIDYDQNPDWKEKWEAQEIGSVCAGALILSANMGKLARDRAFPRMVSDRETVFGTHKEFIDYHRNAPVHSWDDDDDDCPI